MSEQKLRDYLKRATISLHEARARVRELEGQEREPIAIVGMSCRYPGGVRSPEDLWRLVSSGADAIAEFPGDRGWDLERLYDPDPDKGGTFYTCEGGFLYDLPEFDADFFSISPREALTMDPQQRLLLEASWELFEHAGIDPSELRKSRTGVYVGGNHLGYGSSLGESALLAIGGHAGTGTLASILSGRISYFFGLEGPALTVDTGCSSSLVALHLACESLRRRECPLALAGGVAIIATPAAFLGFAHQRALARDGRCKSYADAADGTGWGEGVGLLLLERLSDAQRLGHRVWATVRGSAINQDGASNGLTAPNGRAQRQVVRAALASCGLSPDQVDAVEGHGTGTTLGDPIEAQALLASYGRSRPAERPLWLGSIKSNIGHTQAAAGAAGVIKMVMALQHEQLPRTLHVDEPSTQVDWSAGNVALLTDTRDWPVQEEPRRAGVSSFGVSGTNAHVILEQPPAGASPVRGSDASVLGPDVSGRDPDVPVRGPEVPGRDRDVPTHDADASVPAPVPWVLSAKGDSALREQAARLRAQLQREPELAAADVGFSLAVGRRALSHRAVVLGVGRERLCDGLAALERAQESPLTICGVARSSPEGLAFLFSGQGAQRVGMGRELCEALPEFRDALHEVCACLDPLLGRALLEVVFDDGDLLGHTEFTQPALFALEVALSRTLERWGVTPDLLLGHSIGELAAVHVAGALSLSDAATLAVARGRLMGALPSGGAMVALQASEPQAQELIGEHAHAVTIAAVNGPESVVISGEREQVMRLAQAWKQDGYKTKRLAVSHAFHSPQMDGMLDELTELAASLSFSEPRIPVVSNVDGELLTAERLRDPRYWADHARRSVRFADGVRLLRSKGVERFLEVGPGGALCAMVRECMHGDDAEDRVLALPALQHKEPEADALARAVARLWVDGAGVAWKALYEERGARRVQLPTYAFQRQHYWLEQAVASSLAASSAPADDATVLVQQDASLPGPERSGLDGAAQEAAKHESEPTEQPSELRERLLAVAEEEREGVLLELVCTHVARIGGHLSPYDVDARRTFKDLGFDSLMAVELRRRLERASGLRLPNTLAFNHPTSAAVAAYLLERLGEEQALEQSGGGELSGRARRAARVDVGVREQIAIVGIGCRYPGGVRSQEDLWELVASGTDAISKLPADRGWDLDALYDPEGGRPRTSCTDEGGFLYDAAEFDAGFFGIGPREALMMDPQQRLFLEVSWEAIERAGIDPTSLRGSNTGVFAGVAGQDYGARLIGMAGSDAEMTYLSLGTSSSVLAGRLAYALDLRGPTFTVDAACASSLVALHLACESLRRGESDLAVAGGVTILSTPLMLVMMSGQGGLAPDGRCKSFADRADGVGFAEGAGIVVLERLDDARRLGHDVLALVAGSAVNQDGTSNGLTAPNGGAQERVIRQALADAGLSAAEVDALEAHGTGTRLGDPIEAEAVLATYGQRRSARGPLWIGSVKSNIGHTQAAAGVAGVIKMTMAIQHGALPPTLHVDAPTSQVDWSLGGASLLTEPVAWPRREEPRRAGISGFGMSGTNAHLIVEEPPRMKSARRRPSKDGPLRLAAQGPVAWPLSAKSAHALRAQAARVRSWVVERPDCEALDVGYSLAVARAGLERRAVAVAADRDGLLGALDALACGEPSAALVEGVADGQARAAFVFPGQGSQWPGMALDLLEGSQLFARHMAECARALERHVEWSLLEALRGEPGAPPLDRIDVIQPVLFAVMVSLARLWSACGVRPAAVVGHSHGEIAAAHIAGALSLDDAALLVTRRSRVLLDVAGTGLMASIALSAEQVEARCERWGGRIAVAAANGPRSTVVSGESEPLRELLAECAEQGIRAREVGSGGVPGHSPLIEPLCAQLMDATAPVASRAEDVAFYSTVVAGRMDGSALDAEYWYGNTREPVRFRQTVERMLDDGIRAFIEVSPHPALSLPLEDTLEERQAERARVIPSLRRGEGGVGRFLLSLGEAWTQGVAVDWEATFAGSKARKAALPTYAFQRKRYWASGSVPEVGLVAGGLAATEGGLAAAEGDVGDGQSGASLARQLSEAPPEQRAQAVQAAVLEQVAAVLGDRAEGVLGNREATLLGDRAGGVLGDREAIALDPKRSLLELGFDSTAALELRGRLSTISGLRLPASAILDRPTPAALAEYIHERLSSSGRPPVASTDERDERGTLGGREQGMLSSMLRLAREQGTLGEFMGMLASASSFHPSFDVSVAAESEIEWARLSEDASGCELVCLPTVLALSGPHQYAGFARALPDGYGLSALSLPGFAPAAPLPDSLQAAVGALACAVRRRVAGTSFALVGYSSGGWLAGALASALEDEDDERLAPSAVILLDSVVPRESAVPGESAATLLTAAVSALGEELMTLASDQRLLAMGAYMRLLAGWQLPRLRAPALLVRARESLAGMPAAGADASAGHLAAEVTVPGDHFTLMDERVEATALAVAHWLSVISNEQRMVDTC